MTWNYLCSCVITKHVQEIDYSNRYSIIESLIASELLQLSMISRPLKIELYPYCCISLFSFPVFHCTKISYWWYSFFAISFFFLRSLNHETTILYLCFHVTIFILLFYNLILLSFFYSIIGNILISKEGFFLASWHNQIS